MKKLLALPLPILIAAGFLLLGAGVTFGAIYIGGGGAIQLQKGLVGHWKMDGNAKDSTPRGNNGTLNGNAAITANDRKGQANKAATFDGTGDYIDYGDPADGHLDFGTGDFAIAYWINKTNVPAGIGNQRPFSKGAVSSEVAGYAFFASQLADGITFSLSNGGGLGDGVSRINLGTAAVTLGNWHHVVGQKSGTSQELYVDGVLANSATAPTGSMSTDKSVLLGAVNSPAELFFAGKLDDVRIYNRVLSTAEITALYESYDPGVRVADTQKGLVGNWKLDGNAKDATPYGLSGTLNGNAAVTANDRKGQANKAATFDGTGDYVEIEDSDQFTPVSSGFSVSAWAKINSIQSGGAPEQRRAPIVAKTTGLGGSSAEWEWTLDAKNLNDDNSWGFLTVTPTGSVLSSAQDTDNIVFGDWYHIVGVMETDGRARIYVNGTLKASGNTAVLPSNTAGKVRLGFERGASIDWFTNGSIDDARVYSRALSATEIQALYDSYDPGVRVADTQKGLVSRWKFDDAGDGTAKDSTPNQNNGTVAGATATTDRKGQSNKAYSFDGVDNNVWAADSANLNFGTGDFTATAWIYPTKNSPANNEFSFLSKAINSNSPGWWLETHTWGISGDQINVASYFGKTGSYTSVGAFLTTLNQWHHVVLVRSGTNVKLYGDGVEKVNTTNVDLGLSVNNADALYIGGKTGHNNGFYGGYIDDVRVYNRALSPTEITALYDSYQ